MLRRCIDIRADPRYRRLRSAESCNTKVRDLDCFEVSRKQQIVRLYIAVNHAFAMSMPKTGADLLDIMQGLPRRNASVPAKPLKVAAGQELRTR